MFIPHQWTAKLTRSNHWNDTHRTRHLRLCTRKCGLDEQMLHEWDNLTHIWQFVTISGICFFVKCFGLKRFIWCKMSCSSDYMHSAIFEKLNQWQYLPYKHCILKYSHTLAWCIQTKSLVGSHTFPLHLIRQSVTNTQMETESHEIYTNIYKFTKDLLQ